MICGSRLHLHVIYPDLSAPAFESHLNHWLLSNVEVGRTPAMNELKKDVAPVQVLDEMHERQEWEKVNRRR
jgi:hypothetical protein